ncbi:MAG: hypothetical protein E7240_09240 [Lachnospiraceae bacterium]|nr:hypothetical protein [Lachnospiraceae bacterium]
MLHWSSELYIGEGIGGKMKELRRDLDEGKTAENAWLITLSTNRSNQLDIVHTLFLRQPWIRKSLPMIVGVAGSKKEAMNMVMNILTDSLKTHCGTDMRAYLVEKHHTVM